jgi:hypothetical protein
MATDTDLVGRDTELRRLRAALARAREGRGGLVLVSGEPGIGKSALGRAAVRDAESGGANVFFGHAWELGDAPPYFPLRSACAALGLDANELAREGQPFHAWELLLAALSRAAAQRPLVWLLEDVHAADLGTLDLLTLLAQPLGSLCALVVVTARLKDPRVTERVSQRLTRMARDGEHLALDALDAGSVRVVAERTAGRALPAAALRELVLRTNGNPLFVVECAQALRAGGASASGLPGTVRQVVLDRVNLLPEATKRALAAAAVLGRESTAFLLGRVLDALPARAVDALEPALRSGLLEEAAPGRFAVTHILVRDAIEDALSAAERHELHAAASRALADLPEDVAVLVERPRHALAALGGDRAGGGENGVALALRAATELERQGAVDRAHALHQRIDAARAAGLAPPATPEERLREAGVARAAGRFSDARRTCLAVVAGARRRGDPTLFAEAVLAVGAELRPGVVDRELVALLEEAKAGFSSSNTALGVRVLARLAAALQPAPDPEVPLALARRAITLARELGDPAALVEVLFIAGSALTDFNPHAERVAVSEELCRHALAAGDRAAAVRGFVRSALARAEGGDFGAFSAAVERALALSEEIGAPRHRWRPLLLASMRAVAQGDTASSERAVREVRELEAVSDDPTLSLSLSAHVHAVAILLHRADEIRRLARELAIPRTLDSAAFIEATIRAASFARVEAREATLGALARLGPAPASGQGDYFTFALAEVHAFLGDVEVCRRSRGAVAAISTPHLVGGHVPMTYEGPRARVLALLDSVLGAHTGAETALREALATVTAAGLTPWIAQLEYDLARVLERAGKRAEAASHFARAAAVAAEVPMPGLAERAARGAELSGAAGAGSARAPERVSPAPARCALRRQGELWQLDFDGRSSTLKHSRGIELLARLVERRGEELHVLALASDEPGASLDEGTSPPMDEQAKRAYRRRLAELERARGEADAHHDLGRLAMLDKERAALEAELARAFGLGARARRSGSSSERARVNVQRRLKDAIGRISDVDPECGRFLSKTIRTGNYCVFLG